MDVAILRRALLTLLITGAVSLASAQAKKEFRYSVQPGATVAITNDFGPITVRASTANQVLVTTTAHSNKVEVDGNQSGNRLDIRTHFLQKASGDEGAVDYDVQVPNNAALVVRTAGGTVKVQNVSGDVTVESDTGSVDIRDASNGHVHVRTMSGPVTLNNVRNGHVELTSISGEVTLNSVSGSMVSANTTGAAVHFTGDCGGGGEYTLTSHSGNIDVALPAEASVDVTARSVTGSVEDGFQLQPDSHPTTALAAGKSFAGHANSGAASLHLRTFSGKITVKKQ
jgi:DUF4097 and DUF4098 domain-containing protein YvlB